MDDEVNEVDSGRSTGDIAKLVVSVVILTALVLFGLTNSDDVSVDFLVTDSKIPLIFVILGSAVAGALVAALLRRRRS